MPTTAEGRRNAARHIMRLTGLENHPLVTPHINIDASVSDWDWDGLDREPLSTGERITFEVLRAVVLGYSDARISDLYALDDHYRTVLLDGIRMALVGDEVPVL